MDLQSGLPFWLVRNGLLADFPSGGTPLPPQDVLIIGSGISGALCAHALCSRGHRCTMLDGRLLSSGSTWASTAQLNYEIDTPLYQLCDLYGDAVGAAIYKCNLDSVAAVGKVLEHTGTDASYERRPSLYLASDRSGEKEICKEYETRRRLGFPAELIEKNALKTDWKLNYRLALHHDHAAQLDSYRAAAGIIGHHVSSGALKVFTRMLVEKMQPTKDGVELKLAGMKTPLKAKTVVCAPGYESMRFLPRKIADINSTYALVTQPLPAEVLWPELALIWESARPYFYLRTTPDNRIMMGGGDEDFKNEKLRDALLQKKEAYLLKRCRKLFPHLPPLVADFSWCGSFAETKDGLPYIGKYPGMENIFFALGYGGNGTTFSMTAAGIITNLIEGKPDSRAPLFAFDRKKR
jgi:glycine/D-amino acid oxidase-like deaminating enzyme